MKNNKEQEKLRRWYSKGFWGVYRKTCPVCGAEYFTLFSEQTVCNDRICEMKFIEMTQKQELEQNGLVIQKEGSLCQNLMLTQL